MESEINNVLTFHTSTTFKKMEAKGIKYEFNAMPWKYAGPAGWVFVSIPDQMSKEIRHTFKNEEAGWGRLKAIAKLGNTEWKTAIWFDSKMNTYLLPLKSEIRKKEKIDLDEILHLTIWI